MPTRLWLGPILNERRDELLDRCRGLVASGRAKEFLYLCATRPLLDAVVDDLSRSGPPGLVAPVNAFLLSGFSRYVLANARFAATAAEPAQPLPYYEPIDVPWRPLQPPLISRIVAEAVTHGRLPGMATLGNCDGVVASLISVISEIQRAGCTAAAFSRFVEIRALADTHDLPARARRAASAEETGQLRDRDVATVYSEYAELLDANRLTDATHDYLRTLQALRGTVASRQVEIPFLDDVTLLVIDGFFDLIPVHMEILLLLMRRVPETIVNLNWDPRNRPAYAAFAGVVQRFLDAGATPEQAPCAAPAAPERLVLGLFNESAGTFADRPAPALTLLVARNRAAEVRAVAREIKRLVLFEEVPAADIAVVVRSRDRYESLVHDVFLDERVPTTAGRHTAILDCPPVRAALKVLEAALSARGGRGAPVRELVGIVQSGFLACSRPAATGPVSDQLELPFDALLPEPQPLLPDEIENAAVYVGIELDHESWQARLVKLLQAAIDADGESPRNRIGQYAKHKLIESAAVLAEVNEVVTAIPSRAPARLLAHAIRDAWRRLQLHELARARARAATGTDEAYRAALDLRALDTLERGLDAAVEAFELTAADEVRCADLRVELVRALGAHSLAATSPALAGVRFLNASDVRGLSFDSVFVLGLVDGEFPERAASDWIYTASERRNYRELGLPLEELAPIELLQKEEHYFYQAVCRARTRLYLCQPGAEDDETELAPSCFIDEVRSCYEGEQVETIAGVREAWQRASTARRLACTAAIPLSVISRGLRDALARQAVESGAISDSARRRVDAREATGVTQDELLRLVDAAYARHVYSATELGRYAGCPFAFFAERLLELQPRDEAALDLDARAEGSLLHEVLRRFVGARLGGPFAGSADSLQEELRATARTVFDEFERATPPLNPAVRVIERRILELKLERFLEGELEFQQRLGASAGVWLVEQAFGPGEGVGAVELFRDGETLRLRGRIDRIDRTSEGRVVAYDYKRSEAGGRGPAAIEEGLDLQIGIYLNAVEQRLLGADDVLVGGGYYVLNAESGARNQGLYRRQYRHAVQIRSQCTSLVEEASWLRLRRLVDGYIWRYHDGVRACQFPVDPARGEETCRFCDFLPSRLCRITDSRMRRHRQGDTFK
jgi:ATP-dependent helicase/DNAse subunit B